MQRLGGTRSFFNRPRNFSTLSSYPGLLLDEFRPRGLPPGIIQRPDGEHQYTFLNTLLGVNPLGGFRRSQFDSEIAKEFKKLDRADYSIPYIAPNKLPGFMTHTLSKGGYEKIVETEEFLAGQAMYGTAVFAHTLSAPLDFSKLPSALFANHSQSILFTTSDTTGKLHPRNDEFTWTNNLSIKPVIGNNKGIITIHDYQMAAFLLAQYSEKFEVADRFIRLLAEKYKIDLPASNGLLANGTLIFEQLATKERKGKLIENFTNSIEEALKAHKQMCEMVEKNPKLLEAMKVFKILEPFQTLPEKIVKEGPDLTTAHDLKI